MAVEELFLRLGVALFAGLLIGLERGWQRRGGAEGSRPAGLRTFGLIGLAGGLWALLARELGALVLGLAALVLGLVLAVTYWTEARERRTFGATTEIAAFVAFALGAVAVEGHLAVAAGGAVVTAVLLGLKPPLHGWVERLTEAELRGALKLLLISVVVLPVLPNRGYGPWEAFNPYTIWWLVVLIAGISFVGYVAVRVLGARYGLLLTGFAAGLMASTPLALTFARMGRHEPGRAAVLAAGILAAASTMFPRALVVASVLHPPLATELAPPLLAMMLAGYVLAAWWWRESAGDETGDTLPIRNPFEMGPALRFGVLLALVMLLARALEHWVGDVGLYALALVSGLTDVDAITLSLAGMADTGTALGVAATGIVIAAIANTVFKAMLVIFVGGNGLAWRVGGSALVVVAAGAGVLALP